MGFDWHNIKDLFKNEVVNTWRDNDINTQDANASGFSQHGFLNTVHDVQYIGSGSNTILNPWSGGYESEGIYNITNTLTDNDINVQSANASGFSQVGGLNSVSSVQTIESGGNVIANGVDVMDFA